MKMNDLSFRIKLSLIMGAFLVGILVFASIAFLTLKQVEIGSELYVLIQTDKDLVSDYVPPAQSLSEAFRTILLIEESSDSETTRTLIATAREQERAFKDRHSYFQTRIHNPQLLAVLNGEVYTSGSRFFEKMDSGYLPLVESGQREAAKEFYFRELKPLYLEQTAAVDKLVNTSNEVISTREEEAKKSVFNKTLLMIVTLCLVVAIASLLGVTTARTISLQIARLKDALKSVSEGDLTVAIENCSKDEIGQIGSSLNETVSSMRTVISVINSHAETIASAGEELSATAAEIAQSAGTQKDQTQQVATAMQQMSASVHEVSEASSRTALQAESAETLAVGGGEVVTKAIEVIKSVADAARDTSEKIEELGKASNEIGRVIGVIEEIANQTNLLALNAAIEAARAGEQGRGFAVVAGEVRRLAERTADATKEIEQMISTIQCGTGEAVAAMRDGTVRVDEGVSTVICAGESLQKIIDSSKEMQEMVSQIAAASSEQASATAQVNGNMEQIAQMVQQSSVSASESAKACKELSKLAFELQSAVSRFKVQDDRGHSLHLHAAKNLSSMKWLPALSGKN